MRRSKSVSIAGLLGETDQGQESSSDIDTVGLFTALWSILTSSLSVTLINLAGAFIETINLIFIGHRFDPVYIGAVGIAYCWTNVAAYSLLLGLTSTVELQCTAAFENNDSRLAKVRYNRARVLLSALSLIFIFAFFWYASFWLQLLQIPSEITALSQVYLRYGSPGFFFLIQFEVAKQYANSLLMERPQACISSVSIVLHVLWCYLFVEVLGLGFYGAAIATSITHFTNFFGIFITIWYYDVEQSEDTWEMKEIMEEWWPFIKKGFPGAIMICIEWIGVELLTIESAYLTTVELAVTVIVQNVVSIAFMFSWGISVSASILIESSIEDRSISNAKRYAIRAAIASIIMLLGIGVCLSIFREQIAVVFTNDKQTAELLANLLEYAVEAVILFDGMQGVLGGIIRGVGKDEMLSYGNLACYYLLTQPFAITLGFLLRLGVNGIWVSMGIGLFCNTVFFAGIVVSQDWKKIVVERIEFGSMSQEMHAKSENVGMYNSPEAKKILGLMQNSYN